VLYIYKFCGGYLGHDYLKIRGGGGGRDRGDGTTGG